MVAPPEAVEPVPEKLAVRPETVAPMTATGG